MAITRRGVRLLKRLGEKDEGTWFTTVSQDGVEHVLMTGELAWGEWREEDALGVRFPREEEYQPDEDCFVGKPNFAETGLKNRFYGMEDDGRSDVNMRVSVEVLSLQEYDKAGGWWGLHEEGMLLRMLFGLLFWDQIFASGVRHAFLSPCQDGPLDLEHPWAFYRNRREALEARLSELRLMSPLDLASEVFDSWTSHHGVRCRGVRWDRLPVEILQLAAMGLGGKALSAACKPFLINARYYHGGLPDLFLLRVLKGEQVLALQEWPWTKEEVLRKVRDREEVDAAEFETGRKLSEEDLEGYTVEAMMVS